MSVYNLQISLIRLRLETGGERDSAMPPAPAGFLEGLGGGRDLKYLEFLERKGAAIRVESPIE